MTIEPAGHYDPPDDAADTPECPEHPHAAVRLHPGSTIHRDKWVCEVEGCDWFKWACFCEQCSYDG